MTSRVFSGHVVVPEHDVGAAGEDLPVAVLDPGSRCGPPRWTAGSPTEPGLLCAGQVVEITGRRLRQPVALVGDQPERLHAVDDVLGDGPAAGDEEAQLLHAELPRHGREEQLADAHVQHLEEEHADART